MNSFPHVCVHLWLRSVPSISEFTNSLTELRIKTLEQIFRASFFELSHAKCMIRSKTAKQTPCKTLKYSHLYRNRSAGFFPGRCENFPIGDATVLDDFILTNLSFRFIQFAQSGVTATALQDASAHCQREIGPGASAALGLIMSGVVAVAAPPAFTGMQHRPTIEMRSQRGKESAWFKNLCPSVFICGLKMQFSADSVLLFNA
jgi:hypothetical protein